MIVSLAGNQLFSKTSWAHLSLESIQLQLFQSKNFQVYLLLQTSFEWGHRVEIMPVAVLSGCAGGVYVCVRMCVFNPDACPFSVLETTFYGHQYTSQVTIWQS